MCMYMYMYVYMCVYVYIYIYIYIANNSIIETTSQMQQSNKYTIIYNDIKMTSQTTYNNA